ncbi:alpha/beta hydrolase-fold protein [Streptomyces sp. TRM70308]|uniref:alpha/beta hydrolase n=1 Tax=Streptomyces sp. TRM70308 TaxID=3131932 RepID=UPI003D000EFC
MKRRSLLTASGATAVALSGMSTVQAQAQVRGGPAGRVLEKVSMRSRVLGTDVLYSLYLPPGRRRGRRYPVLCLLHGLGGSHTDWLRLGQARRILDRAIARRRIPPLVVAMPDARRDPATPGDQQPATYYMNDADGSFRYADMIMEEFLPHVEDRYHAGGAAERRSLGGLSMGGFGALSFALRAPGWFAASFALSAGIRTDAQHMALDLEGYNWRYARAWGADLRGRDRLNDLYRQWNVLDTINRTDTETLSRTAWYLDCGAYDQFFAGNADLHMALTRKKVEHRFMSREGAHEWSYWISGLPTALDFLADHLVAER